jgi:antirestriction protein
VNLSEYEAIEDVAQLGQAIAKRGEAAAAYYDHFGEWDEDDFSDKYRGEYGSETDYVEEFYE